MTESKIHEYIDALNNNQSRESVFIRRISNSVDVAKVWMKQPEIKDEIVGNFHSERCFFIRNQQNIYIGAVWDMATDLHWYVVPGYRKQGYLTRSLKESILPYLFVEGREIQRITIEKNSIGEKNYLNSKKVATNLGFISKNSCETEFELGKSSFDWDGINLNEQNSIINSHRFKELRQIVFYAYKLLYKVSDELLMSVGEDKGLKEISNEVSHFNWKIEDIEWENSQ